MDLRQFENELTAALSTLPYVTNVLLTRRTEISLQGIIGLKKSYKLAVFYNEAFYILSFSLIYKEKRIWAIDKDNRVGWHEHPLVNPDLHIPIDELTINQIISKFDQICATLLIAE